MRRHVQNSKGAFPDTSKRDRRDLLDQARQQRNEEKTVSAKRVPLLFWVPELQPLEAWERSERVAAAVRSVNSQVAPILACSAWTGALLAIAWALGIFSYGRAAALPLLGLSVAPWLFIRAIFVRSKLRQQLNQAQSQH